MRKLQCIDYSRKTGRTNQDRISIERNASYFSLIMLYFSICEYLQVSVLTPFAAIQGLVPLHKQFKRRDKHILKGINASPRFKFIKFVGQIVRYGPNQMLAEKKKKLDDRTYPLACEDLYSLTQINSVNKPFHGKSGRNAFLRNQMQCSTDTDEIKILDKQATQLWCTFNKSSIKSVPNAIPCNHNCKY